MHTHPTYLRTCSLCKAGAFPRRRFSSIQLAYALLSPSFYESPLILAQFVFACIDYPSIQFLLCGPDCICQILANLACNPALVATSLANICFRRRAFCIFRFRGFFLVRTSASRLNANWALKKY